MVGIADVDRLNAVRDTWNQLWFVFRQDLCAECLELAIARTQATAKEARLHRRVFRRCKQELVPNPSLEDAHLRIDARDPLRVRDKKISPAFRPPALRDPFGNG